MTQMAESAEYEGIRVSGNGAADAVWPVDEAADGGAIALSADGVAEANVNEEAADGGADEAAAAAAAAAKSETAAAIDAIKAKAAAQAKLQPKRAFSPMPVMSFGAVDAAPPDADVQALAAAILADEGAATPLLEQHGHVVVGAGAIKDAQLLGLGLPKLSQRQGDDLAMSKKYAMEQSVKHVLVKQTLSHQQNQQKIAMYAQALSLMARVYIGSISFEVREDRVKEMFSPFGPIKSINMSYDGQTGHHKGFAFLEYDVPEAALLAQEQMDGLLVGGRNVKVEFKVGVGRPSNMPQAQPIIEMIMEEAKQYHRCYVSSVHPDLAESDIRSVFGAFGKVVSCQLARGDAHGRAHRGYGYIEFATARSCSDAITSMNLFDLGGLQLRVGRAITPPQAQSYVVPAAAATMPTAAAVAAASVTAKIQAYEAQTGGAPSSAVTFGQPPRIVVGNAVMSASDRDVAAATAMQHGAAVFAVPPPGVADVPRSLSGSPRSGSPSGARRSRLGQSIRVTNVPAPSVVMLSAPPMEADEEEEEEEPEKALITVDPSMPNPTAVRKPPPPPPKPKPNPKKVEKRKKQAAAALEQKKRLLAIKAAEEEEGGGGPSDALVAYEAGGVVALRTDDLLKKKKKPKKKKPKKDGANGVPASHNLEDLTYSRTDTDVQTMIAAQTAQKLLASGILTDHQKKLVQSEAGTSIASQEECKIKGNEARNVLMHKLMRSVESTVVVLRNMVGAEDVDDVLQEEVEEECKKFGTVDQVVIYQEQPEDETLPPIVKIFVRFSSREEVQNARDCLSGRFFAGRQITADIYDQALFDHADYSQ